MMITIRNCDWNIHNHIQCDLDNMLRTGHWKNVLGGLKELKIELEIEDERKEILVPVINKLKVFEFEIGEGEWLVAEEHVKEIGWTGPIRRLLAYPQEDKWEDTKYYVATVVWKKRSAGQGFAN